MPSFIFLWLVLLFELKSLDNLRFIYQCIFWDGTNLKLTFRRTVSEQLLSLWEELLAIANSISFSDDEDSLIWELNSQGVYSVQSLYATISFRGIKQIYTPVMWKLKVPPRIHIFLWLLANNKLLTRDNLAKRREVADKTCLFCSDHESTGRPITCFLIVVLLLLLGKLSLMLVAMPLELILNR